MHTVADAIVTALLRHGITVGFGQSLPSALFLAAERQGLRQVSYRTENAGGAMADGFARASNRVTVVGAQNGPAATLLVAPLAEALKVSIPVIALVQDVPTHARDRNAFQELDHFELFRGCTKWIRQLTDTSRVDDYVDAAVTAATSGRPGPVVLLLPKNLLVDESQPSVHARTARHGHFPLDRSRPDAEGVATAARILASAERPVIIAGGGVHISGASASLARLQQHASIPVATTNMGKGAVDETHPLSIGVVGNAMGRNSATRHKRDLITGADAVLLVGTRTNENATDAWTLLPSDADIIHIDVDGTEVGRTYEATRLIGDAMLALDDLTDALVHLDLGKRHRHRSEIENAIAEGRSLHLREVDHLTGSPDSPIRPERVMAELDALLTPETVVVADASYSTIWMNNYLRARAAGQRFLSPRGLAGLGWGFPMALGAQVARPESTVVCISGDGGFGHVWGELETAVREQLPITVIVFNNSILGFQKHAELAQFGAHTRAVNFAPVDHVAIARAAGADGIRVDRADDIRPALERALASSVPVLVEVMTDPDAHPPITLWDAETASDRIAAGRIAAVASDAV